ncbi:hypothetical protein SAMN05421578_101207 [Paenibacillus macquariensis]|uniref:Uncharacterized protein n=1 Tax=Paenibacillus macquariensis TaxID=948756 RepID=A0ABY1JJZ2_9BACL|nr:hypothetical protein SAMN05421578_101207 [Paenibacillus macquariensis]
MEYFTPNLTTLKGRYVITTTEFFVITNLTSGGDLF